ncbi:uncharacterized protein METZ01_LOCUS498045, partial [marine metagenome]
MADSKGVHVYRHTTALPRILHITTICTSWAGIARVDRAVPGAYVKAIPLHLFRKRAG